MHDEPSNNPVVYVLGAGASISATNGDAPSINEVFSRAATTVDFTNPNSIGSYADLARYAQEQFGIRLGDANDHTDFEAFFTNLEIDIEKSPRPQYIAARQQLFRMMRQIFHSLAQKYKTAAPEYAALCERLKPEDSILTFNWDTLLDDALNRSGIIEQANGNRSSVDFAKLQYKNFIRKLTGYGRRSLDYMALEPPEFSTQKPGPGRFLKLHGSVDWLYCTNPTCRGFQLVFPVPSASHTLDVPECQECLEPTGTMIIPPVLDKKLQEPFMRTLWNHAHAAIRTARELVVWGYSLPPTDYRSAWLLRSAPVHRMNAVSIIDPYLKRPDSDTFVCRFIELWKGNVFQLPELRLYENFASFSKGNTLRTIPGSDIWADRIRANALRAQSS